MLPEGKVQEWINLLRSGQYRMPQCCTLDAALMVAALDQASLDKEAFMESAFREEDHEAGKDA